MLTRSSLDGRVFRARDALAAGLVTPASLRSRCWQRLFQGIYADAALTVTHDIRCAAVATLLAPPGTVIAGRSAATLYGAGIGGVDEPVEILVPPSTRPTRCAGITVHRGLVDPADRVLRGGLAVTTPQRTCWDLARWLDPVEAVAWIDRLVSLGRTTPAQLTDFLARWHPPARRGVRRFERVVSLVDARSESPQESRLRVRLALAGLPPPAVQYGIYDGDGRFVARVDLAWPDRRVAVEYDGLWHVGSAAQIHADRRRLNALASLGWTVLHVTSARLRDDFAGITTELRSALARAPR